ncbi:DUF2510 domain-containing protein [Rhodococcus opacus]|uniref:DUF2510 domain-containing protein n=1 Tax=Rhodococcus opacus TaxID=37919 RepID=UPI001E532D29|nr:DUF2510 domain-containing protein [Rhodococcus opacus]
MTPAGWYPDPSGGQRYWDGAKWLDLPDPSPKLEAAGKTKRLPKKWAIGALVALVLICAGGATWKLMHDARVAAAEDAAIKLAAQEEADRVAAENARRAEAQAAQQKRDNAERASREAAVTEIETSVKTMAEGHVAKGLIDGSVISVSCSPVSGGSTDDLTETTTVFECFTATKDNGDGTMSGFKYHATMNWTSGEFTYGMGAP